MHIILAETILVRYNADTHPLTKNCIFQYEFEFIHPFAAGNGRVGRMWHTLLLSNWKPAFAWLPIETLIHKRQDDYYNVMDAANKAADYTAFIEFMLMIICDALPELIQIEQVREQVTEQIKRMMLVLGNEILSAKEFLDRLGLKHQPTFCNNYLRPALELGFIEMTVPGKPNSSWQKYRAIKKIDDGKLY